MEAIQREVEACELCDNIKADCEKMSKAAPHIPYPAALTVQGGNGKPLGATKCAYCGYPHFSASCMSKVQSSERKEILKRDKLCFVCLQVGHCAHQYNPLKCRRCRGQHHQLMCERLTTRIRNHGTKEQEKGTKKPPEQETPEANAGKTPTLTAYQHSITGAT